MADGERDGSRGWLREWLSPLVQALAVLSLLMFGLIRIFYDDFYDNFGITPEDVGASSSVVLTQTAFGVIAFFAAALLINLFLFVLLIPLVLLVRNRVLTVRGKRVTGKHVLKAGLVVAVLSALSLLVLNLHVNTNAAADCALAGGNVTGPSRLLGFRAQRVKVTWLANPGTKPALGKRIMFLGESSGTSFVYDVDRRQTTRFPSNAAALSLLETPDRLCPDY